MADKFDPRFDPRFQPGYAPRSDEPPSEGRVRRRPGAAAPIVDSADADAGQMVASPGPDVPESHPSEADPLEPEPPEPNPFERTLLVLGAALIVGGIAAAFWANNVNVVYGALAHPLSWQQLLQSAAWSLSAPMVTAGLATGVGILFRRAIAWKPPE
jgi:hypothetical protein